MQTLGPTMRRERKPSDQQRGGNADPRTTREEGTQTLGSPGRRELRPSDQQGGKGTQTLGPFSHRSQPSTKATDFPGQSQPSPHQQGNIICSHLRHQGSHWGLCGLLLHRTHPWWRGRAGWVAFALTHTLHSEQMRQRRKLFEWIAWL